MMTKIHTPKILVVDDDPGVVVSLRLLLSTEGYSAITAGNPQEALYFVKNDEVDLVLMDLNYNLDTTSGAEGLSLIDGIKKLDDTLPVVVMTGWATIDIAVQAMQRGAGDFIQKPWENDRVLSIVSNQLKLAHSEHQSQKLSEENQLLKQALSEQDASQFIARSESMQALMATIEQLVNTDINILITGENGTGKSMLAKYIHQQSNTHNQSFVSVNMGAISESLFESEMFGHVKGAFTDAKTHRIGRFELADNGTLFLDEIGNIPLSQQAKLLRVIEEQQFEKVGSSKTQRVSVRVISATNADIEKMVQAGQFRMDLLYRLNTMVLDIPPLRARQQDIAPIASALVMKFAGKYQKTAPTLSHDAITALCQYAWPGNIRELSHILERAVLLAQNDEISAKQLMLPQSTSLDDAPVAAIAQNRQATLDEIEKQVIAQRLDHFKGNAIDAARSLGLSRSAFYRRLEKFNI